MKYSLLLTAAALIAAPAFAQSGHQSHKMPAGGTAPATEPPASDPHAGHDLGTTDEQPVAVQPAVEGADRHPGQPGAQVADPHAGHNMGSNPSDMGAEEIGNTPAPAPPGDHAADAVFGSDVMARSRKELAYEVGGMGYSLVTIDLLEVGFQKGREAYRFEGEAFNGGRQWRCQD